MQSIIFAQEVQEDYTERRPYTAKVAFFRMEADRLETYMKVCFTQEVQELTNTTTKAVKDTTIQM